MAKIDFEPTKVKEFILQLSLLTNKLLEIKLHLGETLDNLKEHWRDDNYEKFKSELRQVEERINEDVFAIDDKIKFWNEKVTRLIEAYNKPLK